MSDKQKPAAAQEPHKPLPAHPVELAEEILQPDITEKLLNAQLAEALFLMRDAGFLYRNRWAEPYERTHYIEHTERLMKSSIGIAERIAQLKVGGALSEKRFRYTVERIEGGRGSEKSENE